MQRLILWHRLIPPVGEHHSDVVSAWTRSAGERMEAIGATVIAAAGTYVGSVVELDDLDRAMRLGLALLSEAEQAVVPEQGLRLCMSLTKGPIDQSPGIPAYTGSAIDRAQWLVSHADSGEFRLDKAARARAGSAYLFLETSHSDPVPGHTVDRAHPFRARERSIRHLNPAPLPREWKHALAPVEEMMRQPGGRGVILRGPSAGIDRWVTSLERERSLPLVLRIGPVPGGLEPLGGLRLALLRRWGQPVVVAAGLEPLGPDAAAAGQVLSQVAKGEALQRGEVAEALRLLLTAVDEEDRHPLLVLDPLDSIDMATLTVVGDATGSGRAPAMVIARLASDARVPTPLRRGDLTEITLPPIESSNAKEIAAVVLGPGTPDDIARRVAVIGGHTTLGIEEAARTLAASGDIVYVDPGFRWRDQPRAAGAAIPTEALIAERVALLSPMHRSILEVACVVPDGSPNSILDTLAGPQADDRTAHAACIEELAEQALLTPVIPGRPQTPSSHRLRSVVLDTMSPERTAEVHASVAQALLASPRGTFANASVGWFLTEGGHTRDGVVLLLDAAQAAIDCNFPSSAVRLAAAAVRADPSEETQRTASAMTQIIEQHPEYRRSERPSLRAASLHPSVELPPDPLPVNLIDQAIEAILARDFESADQHLDMAIAQGRGQTAIDRLRAVAQLARGDAQTAMQTLAASHHYDADNRREVARGSLTMALILLRSREVSLAIRCALRTLAIVRAERDPRGEAATMHLLANCYQALGRGADADAIREASPA